MDIFIAPSTSLVAAVGLLTLLAYRIWLSHEQEKELCRLEAEKDCERPRPWAAHWPWGLDLLCKAFWHGQNRTVCEFFYQISEVSGPTHEQRLLGARNIGTTSPINLKAVLDTQHRGIAFRLSKRKADLDS